MKPCKIKILSTSNGEQTQVTTYGKLLFQNGKTVVLYRQEGDFVTLQIEKSTFSMERKQRLFMLFSPQKSTKAQVFLGENCGEIPVFTSYYSLIEHSDGLSVQLDYELRLSQIQKFSLNIEIQIISEVA